MNLKDKLVNETIKLIESTKKANLIAQDVDSKSRNIINHLIKCSLYPDYQDYSHWKKEIYNFLNDIYLVKGKNMYPSYKQLYKWTIGTFGDVLYSRLDRYIKDIMSDYKIVEYDKNKVYNIIIEYYKWLILNLSKQGEVTSLEVSNKIDELVDRKV